MNRQKLLFLDRDGTIIIDKHYLHDPNEIELIPNVIQALTLFQKDNYLLYIITNQSGIGRGYFTEKDMHAVHERLDEIFKENGIKIEEYLFCPHAPDENCECRKPKPTLIDQVLKNHDYDASNSYMLGDKTVDREAGINAGINGVMIKRDSKTEREGEFLDLLEFYQSLHRNK